MQVAPHDKLFQNLFYTLTQGVVFQRPPDGQIVEVNPAAEQLLGRTRDELIGNYLYDPVWQTQDAIGQPLQSEHAPCELAMRSGEAVRNVIVSFYHPQRGERRWLSVDAVPQFKPGADDPHLVYALFTDITQRYQAEQALRESELRFRTLVKASAQIVWSTDADGHIIEDSPSWRAFTGQTTDAWMARNNDGPAGWAAMVHPDERASVWAQWQQAIAGKEAVEGTFRLFHARSGMWRWIAIRAVPLLHPNGTVRGWVGMNTDIDERKKSQEALLQSVNRYRTLAANLPGGAAFEVDRQLRYILAEGEALREIGMQSSHFEGKTLEEALGPDLANAYRPMYEQALAGQPFHWEHEVEGRYFVSRGTPLRNEQGEVYAVLAVSYDITERRQNEEALRQAKQTAEQAARAKEEFLAHMSHEIRTPLNAVVGLTDLLLLQTPRADQTENLQTLKFSAENLKMLVDDILDFSKIQAGKVSVETIDFSLTDLLTSLEKVHQPQAKEQRTMLQFHTDERIPPTVCTDQLKLSQVLNNLISNALKFTQHGSVTVETVLNHRQEDRLWIDFSVSDTGIGIAADQLDHIFETFTQADSSTVRQYGGTGLGLSITKSLLALMGSRIQVSSQPGKGSRFFFTLPLQVAASLEAAAQDIPPPPGNFSHWKLLLVDDAAINRMLIVQFVRDWWQLTPDEVTNGQKAVEAAQRTQYDLILMDLRMPVMDGYEATRRIRALPHYAHPPVPIIALTADTEHEIEKHASHSLFTDVVTKPFNPEDLRRKIQQHLLVQMQ